MKCLNLVALAIELPNLAMYFFGKLFQRGQNLIVNEYTKDTGTVHADGERVHLSFDPARISLYRADTEEVLSL